MDLVPGAVAAEAAVAFPDRLPRSEDISEKTFKDTITGSGIVLVDFWAAWCGPCRMFAPTFSKASDNHPDVVFAKVDTEAEPGLFAAASITSIPTLMAFREGILVFSGLEEQCSGKSR